MAKPKLAQVPESIPVGKGKSKGSVLIEVDDPHGQLEISSGGIKWTPRGDAGRLRGTSAIRLNWKQFVSKIANQ